MTETLIRPAAVRPDAGWLRAVLLVDGLGTAAVGVAALALAEPLAEHLASTGALQAVGVFFVVGGLVWAAVCVTGLALLDTTALGTGIVLAVVATCLSMGTAKLALARRLA